MDVKGFENIVANAKVFGMTESVIASGYPMKAEVTSKETIEEKDFERAEKLSRTDIGQGHDQFLTGIIVQFDLTFSIKAWVEAERYHFLDFVSSQSTMHKIASMDLKLQCNEYVDSRIMDLVSCIVENYNENKTPENYLRVLYNIPTGFRLTARMTTNYRQLKTVYNQRKNHTLPEWRRFCDWIKTLPNSSWITGE